ncbi:MAG: hypothetical protein HY231_03165 [Acidobacteria bacterium]|nr:hypothetical protein [Acidobacteriota bacterium]
MKIHTTKELAVKLETAEALNQLEFVRTHQRLFADSTAGYEKIGSGYAVFAGVESPLTQIFALGFDDDFSEAQLDRLEAFYQQRKAAVNVEVCHLADINLLKMLIRRGYQISEVSNVLARRIGSDEVFSDALSNHVQRVGEEDIERFSYGCTEPLIVEQRSSTAPVRDRRSTGLRFQ